MLFRILYKVLGSHTHFTLFAGKGASSLGCAGDMILRNEEFDFLKAGIERTVGNPGGIGHHIEFVERNSP